MAELLIAMSKTHEVKLWRNNCEDRGRGTDCDKDTFWDKDQGRARCEDRVERWMGWRILRGTELGMTDDDRDTYRDRGRIELEMRGNVKRLIGTERGIEFGMGIGGRQG